MVIRNPVHLHQYPIPPHPQYPKKINNPINEQKIVVMKLAVAVIQQVLFHPVSISAICA
jgi:hypothetical protein